MSLIKNKQMNKIISNLILSNTNLTIVLTDGSCMTKNPCTYAQYEAIKNVQTLEELFQLVVSEEVLQERKKIKIEKERLEKERKQIQNVIDGFEVLKNTGLFEFKDNSVYLKGINRSLPKLLINRFCQIAINYAPGYLNPYPEFFMEDNLEFISLKRFFLKCCVNPNIHASEDLYDFLDRGNMHIDRFGNFYAYRRVKKLLNKNSDLVKFVSNQYTKILGWKKRTGNYCVASKLGEYKLFKNGEEPKDDNPYWVNIGNLKELYLNLPSYQENNYTSAHTGTEDYRVGSIIEMPRNETDEDKTRDCSKGFHLASAEYDYSGFGDTPILAICSPSDVVAIPENGKLRTCRWFFASVLENGEESKILNEENFDVSELGERFEELMMENLEEKVQNSFVEEIKRHSFELPKISTEEIRNIVEELQDISNILKNRIINI